MSATLAGWCLAARRPTGMENGTSYGYRDAWAIGVNARYVIGSGLADRTARPLLVSLALPVRTAVESG